MMDNKNWEIDEPTEYLCTKSHYLINGNEYHRVTHILGVISKPALIYWYAKNGMKKCKQILHLRAEFGTTCHKLFEIMMAGGIVNSKNYNEEMQTTISDFNTWRDEHEIESQGLEVHLWSETYKYAGTTDFIGLVDGKLTILDWKTSKAIYNEYWLQIAAYVHAFEELTGVKVDQVGILCIRDGKTIYKVKTYEEMIEHFPVFLASKVIFDWRQKKK